MIHSKLVTAGPRGNKCRKCGEKTKAPALLLKTVGEYNRFSGHPKQDNYCEKCAKEVLEKDLDTLKSMLEALENGTEPPKPGTRKVRRI